MALRKPLSRCNNSSSRDMRENHYAILALLKISQVFTYKMSITLPYFNMSLDGVHQSECKDTIFFEFLTVERGDPAKMRLRSPHFYRRDIVKVC